MARALVIDHGTVEFTEADLVRLAPKETGDQVAAGMDPEAVYVVQMIGPEKFQAIRRKWVRQGFNPRTHVREELPLTEDDARAMVRELIDAVLVDWRGVVDARTGQALACTPEMREALPSAIANALIYVSSTRQAPSQEERAASFRGPAGVADVVEH